MIQSKDIGEYIIYSNGDVYSKYFKKMMFQKPTNNKWYKRFPLRDKSRKMVTLHRVIAENFIPNPNNYPEVNHKDGNKRNNHVDNLEWCTPKQNREHARRTGLLINQVMGSKHKDSKLTPIQAQVVKEALELGYVGYQIARYFKMNRSSIYRIKNGEHWKQLV